MFFLPMMFLFIHKSSFSSSWTFFTEQPSILKNWDLETTEEEIEPQLSTYSAEFSSWSIQSWKKKGQKSNNTTFMIPNTFFCCCFLFCCFLTDYKTEISFISLQDVKSGKEHALNQIRDVINNMGNTEICKAKKK